MCVANWCVLFIPSERLSISFTNVGMKFVPGGGLPAPQKSPASDIRGSERHGLIKKKKKKRLRIEVVGLVCMVFMVLFVCFRNFGVYWYLFY